MLIHRLRGLGCAAAMLSTPSVWAGELLKELPSRSYLPTTLAQRASVAAWEACKTAGYKISVAVVDRGGVVLAMLRDEHAGVHTADSARRKAYTAASLREPTQKLAELAARRPELAGLQHMNASILLLGGGFPVRIAGQVVGGIGVGGAPGANFDEACARAGLQAIGARHDLD